MPETFTDEDLGILFDEDVGLGADSSGDSSDQNPELYTDAERDAILNGPAIDASIPDKVLNLRNPGVAPTPSFDPYRMAVASQDVPMPGHQTQMGAELQRSAEAFGTTPANDLAIKSGQFLNQKTLQPPPEEEAPALAGLTTHGLGLSRRYASEAEPPPPGVYREALRGSAEDVTWTPQEVREVRRGLAEAFANPDDPEALDQARSALVGSPDSLDKILAGADKAVIDSAAALLEPENLPFLAMMIPGIGELIGTAALKAITAAFMADMAGHAPEMYDQINEALRSDDPQKKAELLGKAAIGSLFFAFMGAHLTDPGVAEVVRGLPPESRAKIASEKVVEPTLPERTTQQAEAHLKTLHNDELDSLYDQLKDDPAKKESWKLVRNERDRRSASRSEMTYEQRKADEAGGGRAGIAQHHQLVDLSGNGVDVNLAEEMNTEWSDHVRQLQSEGASETVINEAKAKETRAGRFAQTLRREKRKWERDHESEYGSDEYKTTVQEYDDLIKRHQDTADDVVDYKNERERKSNASQVTSPTEVHGDLRTQSGGSPEQVPIENGGQGVRPDTTEKPANALEQSAQGNQPPTQPAEGQVGQVSLVEDPHGVIADEGERNLFQQFADRAVEGGNAKRVRVLKDADGREGLSDRAMAYDPTDGSILVNREQLLQDLSRFEPGSEAQFKRLDTLFKHEEGHGAVDENVTPEQAGELWNSLPKIVQNLFGKFYGEWSKGTTDIGKGHEYLRHVRDWALGEDPYGIFEAKGLKSITQRAINVTLRAIHEAQKRLPTQGGARLRATLGLMEGKLKRARAIKARGGNETFSAPKTSEELDQIKEDTIRVRMKAGINPDNVRITVNKFGLPEGKGDYVQIDEVHPEKGNTFSSNPEQLRSLGMNIPTRADLMKLPHGTHTLTEARKLLAEPAGSKGKAHFDSYQYGQPKFTVASGPGGKYVSHISPEEAVQRGYTVPSKFPTEREWRMGSSDETFSAPKSKILDEDEIRKLRAKGYTVGLAQDGTIYVSHTPRNEGISENQIKIAKQTLANDNNISAGGMTKQEAMNLLRSNGYTVGLAQDGTTYVSRTPRNETFSAPKSKSKTEIEQEKTKGRADLREVLRRAQAAGQAGRKAGIEEKAAQVRPVMAELKAKLSDSITKAQALSENLRGQQSGSALGARMSREAAERADAWLEGDARNIRDSLNKLVDQLPVAERGRFTQAITQAMARPPLFSKGPLVGGQAIKLGPKVKIIIPGERVNAIENMYRKAAQVAARIEDRISQVEINSIKSDIADFAKHVDSPRLDVPYRQAIRTVLSNFEQLKKAGDIPKDALIAMRDTLTSLRDIGRSEQNVKEALWAWQKEFAVEQLKQQPTRPLESRPELRPVPGEKAATSMKLRNWIRKAQQGSSILDKALAPIDALFDLMGDAKGTYEGWLFRHARGPIDLAFNQYSNRRNRLIKTLDDHIKATKLTAEQGERIGVYAQNKQEGGRQRMIDAGLKPATIDRIVASMTPAELKAYDIMRKAMDSQLPEVQDLMRRLYNTEVKPVEDYFPMPRDWKLFEDRPPEAPAPGTEAGFDTMATWKALKDDFFPRDTTQARKGFTLERQEGAKSPVRIDAFDIFRQHINDVAYLIEHQPALKRLGEIARSDDFRARYGDLGRHIFMDWLDTVARQGGTDSFRRWKLLDTVRKNTSVGIIGFRVASQLVHLSNIPYIVARIGHWFGTGLRESFTDRGQQFISDHFAEVKERSGGEPGQAEVEKEGVKLFGQTVVPQKVVRASMYLAKIVDRMNAQGSALGTYLKILNEKGVNWRDYDRIPVDQAAINKALVLTRRAIASPLPKDVPQALSRGTLTGGNVSLGRSAFQFQNIFLDQFSNLRHDLFQAGIVGKNPKLAGAMLLAVLGATYLETQIKEGVKKVVNKVSGKPEPAKEKPNHDFIVELLRRFPFGGQLANAVIYGETGVPAIDAVTDLIKKTTAVAKTNYNPRKTAAIKAAGAAGSLLGIPGSSQLSDIAANKFRGATQTPAQQIGTKARRFMEEQGTPMPTFQQTDEADYGKLRSAVRAGDYKGAKKIFAELAKTRPPGKIMDAQEKFVDHPFTGSSAQDEHFFSTLSDEEKALFQAAKQQRAEEFQKLVDHVWSQ